MLGQISLTMIAAVGLSLLIISGEVDLSIGSLQAVVALPLLIVMNKTGASGWGSSPPSPRACSSASSTACSSRD